MGRFQIELPDHLDEIRHVLFCDLPDGVVRPHGLKAIQNALARFAAHAGTLQRIRA